MTRPDLRTATERARAAGWELVDKDPTGEAPGGPYLYHAELDRLWPADDPAGAVSDLGLDE